MSKDIERKDKSISYLFFNIFLKFFICFRTFIFEFFRKNLLNYYFSMNFNKTWKTLITALNNIIIASKHC